MILANCYYVTYYVADFAKDDEATKHEDAYQSYDNALLVAKELIKCRDILGGVCVVDGATCEMLDEFFSDNEWHRNGNETTPIDSFEDGLGGVWRRDADRPDLWSYDCSGKRCNECPYNEGIGPCFTDSKYLEDVKDLIAETKERIGK